MTYSDKVKAANTIISAVNRLRDNEHIVVTYGTDYNNEPKRYKIVCHIFRDNKPSYSICRDDVWAMAGMNIDKFTGTTAKAYTYDMMNQRTQYTFPLYDMELVEEPFLATTHDYKF